ncbi:hypothetical protein NLP_1761 [Nostoc sp. 'Lobaria pulmonaria (5183) cyanobiont']|nr:hypothetical protein NLP_1761 [Nostoc sp. 'Lobaria pulmonaria (5183) cyanobiont']
MFSYKDESARAASATYRKVKAAITETLGIDLPNTKYPNEDFQNAVDLIDEKILNAYKQGLKRGFRQVIAWIADGTIICKNGEFKVNADLKLEIKRVKPDGTYQILKYKLTPVDLGLEKRESD